MIFCFNEFTINYFVVPNVVIRNASITNSRLSGVYNHATHDNLIILITRTNSFKFECTISEKS